MNILSVCLAYSSAFMIVDGFSLHQPTTAASVRLLVAGGKHQQPTGRRSPWALRMSDISYDDVCMAPETDAMMLSDYDCDSSKEQVIGAPSFLPNLVQQALTMMLSMAVLYKLAMDGGDASLLTHGWGSLQEVVQRTGADVWATYMQVLTEHPIATKAATSATVYTIGDVIAQRTEGASTMGDIDRARTLRSCLAGGIGHGPLSHFWYQISEHFFQTTLHVTTQWWGFIPKIILDQSLWGPIWNNCYIVLLGIMKLDSIENIVSDVKRTTIPLVLSGLKLWPLAHCVTYGLIPVENRLLWVDTVEIAWVTILATQAAGASGDHAKTAALDEEDVDAGQPELALVKET